MNLYGVQLLCNDSMAVSILINSVNFCALVYFWNKIFLYLLGMCRKPKFGSGSVFKNRPSKI